MKRAGGNIPARPVKGVWSGESQGPSRDPQRATFLPRLNFIAIKNWCLIFLSSHTLCMLKFVASIKVLPERGCTHNRTVFHHHLERLHLVLDERAALLQSRIWHILHHSFSCFIISSSRWQHALCYSHPPHVQIGTPILQNNANVLRTPKWHSLYWNKAQV